MTETRTRIQLTRSLALASRESNGDESVIQVFSFRFESVYDLRHRNVVRWIEGPKPTVGGHVARGWVAPKDIEGVAVPRWKTRGPPAVS